MNPKNRPALLMALLATAVVQLPAAVDTKAPEEIVTLNPFQVTAGSESGYRATNTLDGSRLNTALRDTPGAISVFTRDFLDDIAATDIRDILRYDINTEEGYADDQAAGGGAEANGFTDGVSWRTRGLRTSTSTDGFRTGSSGFDTYNMESVGSTRGPNAILFGTGAAGGMLNFRTKHANALRNANHLELKIGAYEAHRGALDVNRVLIKDRFALRAMALYDNEGSHTPYKFTRKQSATLAGQYNFAEATSLNVSYEQTKVAGVAGRPWGPLDNISKFVRAIESGQIVWDPAQERYENRDGSVVGASVGAGNVANRTLLVYGPGLGTPVLWEGATSAANRTTLATNASFYTGAPVPIAPEWIAPLGEVTATGGSEYGEIDFHNFTGTFTHRVTEKLYMELAVNQSSRHSHATLAGDPPIAADLNYRLPDGSLNPYFYGNGYYFMQTSSFLRQKLSDENLTLRGSLSYELNLGKRWGSHRFAAMAERNVNNYRRDRLREVWAGPPFGGTAVSAPNQIARRRYIKIDSPWDYYTTGFPGQALGAESYRSTHAAIGTLTSGAVPANALDFDDEIVTDSQLIVAQSYLFNRRLVTTLGLRYDRVDTFGPKKLLDASSQAFRLASAADQPFFAASGTDWFDRVQVDGLRESLGAVYHINAMFSLTANVSSGVELPDRNRSVLPTEQAPLPYQGESRDYGVSFSFLDNKVSGSVKHFESSSKGEQANGGVTTAFVQPNNDVMASFDYYFRQAGLTTFGAGDPIQSIDELRSNYFSQAAAYLSDFTSSGQELEVMANPTPNWSVRFNYSRTERQKTNVLNEGVPWWADRVALWKSLDALYVARTGRASIFNQLYSGANDVMGERTVAQRIADSDTELAEIRLTEEQGYGNRKHKANIWARYRFTDGRLKGLSFAGGWRYQSRNVAGADLLSNTPLYGNARSLFDLMVQYRTKGILGSFANRTEVTYQINVLNVLDDDTLYITKLALDDVTRERYIRRGFREDPRNVSLTVRMDF